MRLLFVQYVGDYREAVNRLAAGGDETYYAQKYSVDAVAKIGKEIEEAAVLCCMTEEPYNEVLQNGVRAIGAGFDRKIQAQKLIRLIEEQNPTHLIVRTPIRPVLRWAIKNKVKTSALFAESFSTETLRQKFRNYKTTRLLNNPQIEWVFNHGITASLSLQGIGVDSNKIIPWDWPFRVTPDSFTPKAIRTSAQTWNLVYVGSVLEAKGVGDILDALALLRADNIPVRLKIAGRNQSDFFIKKAKQLKIEDCVEFLGLIPNNKVVHLMREADLVLVPSRHEYPEGLPITIYEALCSRTPLIASDHPMFKKSLKHGLNAMIFPAGDAMALSDCIGQLILDPELYRRLSEASSEAWHQLQIPVKWAELINRWLDDLPENQHWLYEHRLSSGQYNLTDAYQTPSVLRSRLTL